MALTFPEPPNTRLFKEWLVSHGGHFHSNVRYTSGRCYRRQFPRITALIGSPFTRSPLWTFNRSKGGHRVRLNHRSLSFFNNHYATSFQKRLAPSPARRVYARTLDRATIDHRLHLLSLDCEHRHVK
jgi:hypothetical protein